jgi:hypothetical protein
MKDEAMVPIVHPQIAAIAFPFVHDFQSQDTSRELLPFFQIPYAESYVAELCNRDHRDFLLRVLSAK